MSMYLPNPDLHPTGYEPAEFLDVPPMGPGRAGPLTRRAGVPTEPPQSSAARLDTQTRLNITRWAEEYIAGLVEDHNGNPEDVRSVIHQLHDQITPAAPRDR